MSTYNAEQAAAMRARAAHFLTRADAIDPPTGTAPAGSVSIVLPDGVVLTVAGAGVDAQVIAATATNLARELLAVRTQSEMHVVTLEGQVREENDGA